MAVRLLIILLPVLSGYLLYGQATCTLPGQTPVSALTVCSADPMTITTPEFCGNLPVPVNCPAGFAYQNTNPFFFRMACYNSGTLGFLITPSDNTANFDWQLADITNRNPFDIYTAAATFVACNWSAEPGETGASPDGTDTLVCAGSGLNTFSRMPVIRQGRTYLLMVLNQSNSAGAFQLTITGGSATITDDLPPKAVSATAGCDGRTILVKLNKKINCSSIAADGSDFSLGNGIQISGASAVCTNSNNTDSVYIRLSQPLPTGNYSLTIQNGSDNNTLIDICNKPVPAGQQLNFGISGVVSTTIEELSAKPCAPDRVLLQFNRPVRCNSLQADGAQFSIAGPVPVRIQSAEALSCNSDGLTTSIELRFSMPVTTQGRYTVQPVTANGLYDECGLEITAPVPAMQFSVEPGVSARFAFSSTETCNGTQISFSHNGANNVNSWNWNFGLSGSSPDREPVQFFSTGGVQQVQLIVSNGFCMDTTTSDIPVAQPLQARFETNKVICPEDTLTILNQSSGDADQWNWQFGNGVQSNLAMPRSIRLQPQPLSALLPVTLIARNSRTGCSDTVRQFVQVLSNCRVVLPAAFTPNNDGLNDVFGLINTEFIGAMRLSIYNRQGQLVFYSTDKTKKWDGRLNGQMQDHGVYVWLLEYTLTNTTAPQQLKGTVTLIR